MIEIYYLEYLAGADAHALKNVNLGDLDASSGYGQEIIDAISKLTTEDIGADLSVMS